MTQVECVCRTHVATYIQISLCCESDGCVTIKSQMALHGGGVSSCKCRASLVPRPLPLGTRLALCMNAQLDRSYTAEISQTAHYTGTCKC